MMKTSALALLAMSLFCMSPVYADTFGSGGNVFDIEFVRIGDPGNAADTTGDPSPPHLTGSVAQAYRIGKFEISEQMIDKANAQSLADGHPLGITKDTRGPDKPATSVDWFEAAKFVNWLNLNSESTPAYKFDAGGNFQLWQSGDAGFNSNNLYRNSLAKYFLPSLDEWYKAAYYDPTSDVYYDYPTGSDNVPDGINFAGDSSFDAVFYDGGDNLQPNDITDVGVLSPYGTAGQGGNVYEWDETDFLLTNASTSSARGARGGAWNSDSTGLLSLAGGFGDPSVEFSDIGFRVASNIPEPATFSLFGVELVGLCVASSRSTKRGDRGER